VLFGENEVQVQFDTNKIATQIIIDEINHLGYQAQMI
jgi:hypothetical protein